MLGHLHSHKFGKMSVPGEFQFPFRQPDTKSFCCEPSRGPERESVRNLSPDLLVTRATTPALYTQTNDSDKNWLGRGLRFGENGWKSS